MSKIIFEKEVVIYILNRLIDKNKEIINGKEYIPVESLNSLIESLRKFAK